MARRRHRGQLVLARRRGRRCRCCRRSWDSGSAAPRRSSPCCWPSSRSAVAVGSGAGRMARRGGRIVLVPTAIGALLHRAFSGSTSPGRRSTMRRRDADRSSRGYSSRWDRGIRLAIDSRRPRHRRRAVHRAVLRRGAGLGRRRPARPRHRRRQRAQGRLHGRRRAAVAPVAKARLDVPTIVRGASASRTSSSAVDHRLHDADELDSAIFSRSSSGPSSGSR